MIKEAKRSSFYQKNKCLTHNLKFKPCAFNDFWDLSENFYWTVSKVYEELVDSSEEEEKKFQCGMEGGTPNSLIKAMKELDIHKSNPVLVDDTIPGAFEHFQEPRQCNMLFSSGLAQELKRSRLRNSNTRD